MVVLYRGVARYQVYSHEDGNVVRGKGEVHRNVSSRPS